MYNIYQNRLQTLEFLIMIFLKKHWLIALLLSIFTLAFWYFFVYCYISSQIINYKVRIRRLEKIKSKSFQAQQDCVNLDKKLKDLELSITQNSSKQKSFYNKLSRIIRCIINNNLTLKQCFPDKKTKSNWYSKSSFKLNINGYYLDIYRFFNCLSKIDCFIEITQCTIKRVNQKLECTLTLNFIEII